MVAQWDLTVKIDSTDPLKASQAHFLQPIFIFYGGFL